VHLEFPEDIAAEQIEAQPVPESNARRPTAEEKSFVPQCA
jgi:hypothetical protein